MHNFACTIALGCLSTAAIFDEPQLFLEHMQESSKISIQMLRAGGCGCLPVSLVYSYSLTAQ